jgi:polyphosphate glucokinase
MRVLGIDVGGSGVKGAVVDTRSGKLLTKRYRLSTPVPSTPKALGQTIARVAEHFAWKGPVGCGMPGPVKEGVLMLANNLDPGWSGLRVDRTLSQLTGCRTFVVNDADAAGIAEMTFGAGKRKRGTVLLVTLGTGIGSSLFVDGRLVPNTELGQFELRGKRAELRASAAVRKQRKLSWGKWSARLQEYFDMVELLLWPDLIIIGGGVSRRADRFIPRLRLRAKVIPARLRNEAGLVGAALHAAEKARRRTSRSSR